MTISIQKERNPAKPKLNGWNPTFAIPVHEVHYETAIYIRMNSGIRRNGITKLMWKFNKMAARKQGLLRKNLLWLLLNQGRDFLISQSTFCKPSHEYEPFGNTSSIEQLMVFNMAAFGLGISMVGIIFLYMGNINMINPSWHLNYHMALEMNI